MKKKGLIGMFLVVILSMIFKIFWINNIPLSPVYDFETFYKVAVNLFNGEGFTLNGYPWAFQSYGYPLFLSLFFRFINDSSVFSAKVLEIKANALLRPIHFPITEIVPASDKVMIGFKLANSPTTAVALLSRPPL